MDKGVAFERLVSRYFRARLTQKSYDGGVDLRGYIDSIPYIISCKNYSKPISVRHVRELVGVLNVEADGTIGVMCTRNGMSHEANKFFGACQLPLVHFNFGGQVQCIANAQMQYTHGIFSVSGNLYKNGVIVM